MVAPESITSAAPLAPSWAEQPGPRPPPTDQPINQNPTNWPTQNEETKQNKLHSKARKTSSVSSGLQAYFATMRLDAKRLPQCNTPQLDLVFESVQQKHGCRFHWAQSRSCLKQRLHRRWTFPPTAGTARTSTDMNSLKWGFNHYCTGWFALCQHVSRSSGMVQKHCFVQDASTTIYQRTYFAAVVRWHLGIGTLQVSCSGLWQWMLFPKRSNGRGKTVDLRRLSG